MIESEHQKRAKDCPLMNMIMKLGKRFPDQTYDCWCKLKCCSFCPLGIIRPSSKNPYTNIVEITTIRFLDIRCTECPNKHVSLKSCSCGIH